MNYAIFPPFNAALNGASAIFLVVGFYFIRNKNKAAHRFCMLSAFTTSVIFLACYLYYHFNVGALHFTGQGPIRYVYFTLLITHTILAALVPVLAILALTRALRGDFKKHKAIARIALPIWLYVSVTGVVIYWILYWLYPSYN